MKAADGTKIAEDLRRLHASKADWDGSLMVEFAEEHGIAVWLENPHVAVRTYLIERLSAAEERERVLRTQLTEQHNAAAQLADAVVRMDAWKPGQNQCLEMANIYRNSEETEEAFLLITEYVRLHMLAAPAPEQPSAEKAGE